MNLRTRGEGVIKAEVFADIIYGSPLSTLLARKALSSCFNRIDCPIVHRWISLASLVAEFAVHFRVTGFALIRTPYPLS